jgi:AcrR family transcriptional regulator
MLPKLPKSRRPNREEVRSSILQTARDIAATSGWSAVTVRKVAEHIGYTAPIIYEHFGSKDEMLTQILKEGYELLCNAVVEAAGQHEDSYERMHAMAVAYWDFAHESPELYRLMYGMEAAFDTKAAELYAAPLLAFTIQEFTRYVPERATPDKVHVIAVEAWSILHGLTSLDISGYVTKFTDGRTVFETLLPDMLYALKRRQM